MQNISRRFNRITTKTTANDSQIAVLLKDFEDADMLLGKIVESTQAWRDAWISIATYQSRMIDEIDGLYGPIVGSSETPSNHQAVQTDSATLARTNRLRREYDELRTDLVEELNAVDIRLTQPASQAKESLIPMKKTIKKRNTRKTDFEISQGRVDSLIKKPKRSDRENASLAKAETELASAKEVYQAADADLRGRLPKLVALVFSLTPYLLEAQVEIQNRMLAHYYTVLHTFCIEEGFPSPPPDMEQIVQDFECAFNPVRNQIDKFGCMTQGKLMRRASEQLENKKRPPIGGRTPTNVSSISLPTSFGRTPTVSQTPISCVPEYPPSPPSSTTGRQNSAIPVGNSAVSPPASTSGDYFNPPPITSSTKPPPAGVTFSPAGPNIDHFQSSRGDRFESSKGGKFESSKEGVFDVKKALVGKKRPPPPPAARPNFVTALYDFDGQGDGDLVFREGDRIRVVHKTNSVDDWWEGELGGIKGAFPANYVE